MGKAATEPAAGWLRRPRPRAAVAATLLILPVLTLVVAEADIGPFDASCDQRADQQLKVLREVLDAQLPPERASGVRYEDFCEYSDGGGAIWHAGSATDDDVRRLLADGWAEVPLAPQAPQDPPVVRDPLLPDWAWPRERAPLNLPDYPAPVHLTRTVDGHRLSIFFECDDLGCDASAWVE